MNHLRGRRERPKRETRPTFRAGMDHEGKHEPPWRTTQPPPSNSIGLQPPALLGPILACSPLTPTLQSRAQISGTDLRGGANPPPRSGAPRREPAGARTLRAHWPYDHAPAWGLCMEALLTRGPTAPALATAGTTPLRRAIFTALAAKKIPPCARCWCDGLYRPGATAAADVRVPVRESAGVRPSSTGCTSVSKRQGDYNSATCRKIS
mmetsp:Transcript_51992/g.114043  ORF Transcript_51992/g.114043 Transcript_51992/m.114043 type:complete len:208 (+) Transcript_51992:82-705(+)